MQIVLDKVSPKDGDKVTFETEEYRKYLSWSDTILGIDGTLRRTKNPNHKQYQVLIEASLLKLEK